MTDDRTVEIQTLYQQGFRDFGSVALWNMRPVNRPTPADALAITMALRTHGRMDGRRLAERIEPASQVTQFRSDGLRLPASRCKFAPPQGRRALLSRDPQNCSLVIRKKGEQACKDIYCRYFR